MSSVGRCVQTAVSVRAGTPMTARRIRPRSPRQTDADGYVTAVELHIDTDDVVNGTGTDVKK